MPGRPPGSARLSADTFATTTQRVIRVVAAYHEKHLQAYLGQLERAPLIITDEVCQVPFDAEAANCFFQLVSSRNEPGSVIITPDKPFTAWGQTFGDPVVAAVMMDSSTTLRSFPSKETPIARETRSSPTTSLSPARQRPWHGTKCPTFQPVILECFLTAATRSPSPMTLAAIDRLGLGDGQHAETADPTRSPSPSLNRSPPTSQF